MDTYNQIQKRKSINITFNINNNINIRKREHSKMLLT